VLVDVEAGEIDTVNVTQRPVFQRVLVNNLGTDGHLHALNGVENKQAKLAVKSIAVPDGFEGSSRLKGVIGLSKGNPVGTQAIVADGLKFSDDGLFIWRHQTALQ
jgi:hypothetical protein